MFDGSTIPPVPAVSSGGRQEGGDTDVRPSSRERGTTPRSAARPSSFPSGEGGPKGRKGSGFRGVSGARHGRNGLLPSSVATPSASLRSAPSPEGKDELPFTGKDEGRPAGAVRGAQWRSDRGRLDRLRFVARGFVPSRRSPATPARAISATPLHHMEFSFCIDIKGNVRFIPADGTAGGGGRGT
ncbi:hypothetical protein GCM10007904_10270 [Oharaeibacter diazotrophicus]|nr:hypothetical protein GCM10007904_10270 [Oharaeibacter diazotrophicus]